MQKEVKAPWDGVSVFKLHLICNERGELLNFIPNRSSGLLFAVRHREILMTDLGL